MKKVLVVGDTPSVPTGFSSVVLNIFKHFPKEEFEIHQLGINYYGDPHTIGWNIYPAVTSGDMWGFGRIKSLIEALKPDLIFILNDVWVVDKYLDIIKREIKNPPPIVVYYPVDSKYMDIGWFKNFDIVTTPVVYTQFGYNECKRVVPDTEFTVIPHGVDSDVFFKIDLPKSELKKALYPDKPEFYDDSFIVLNSNRNQPRKRIDITIEAFYLFATGKPDNVKLYLHMGSKDAGWDIFKLTQRYGIDKRLIITNNNAGIQTIPAQRLNMIYNATDVGINTSVGEGWGLCNVEHGVTGAPQVVPNHSANYEVWGDCGILVPANNRIVNPDTLTLSLASSPEDLASGLETLYTNKKLYETLSDTTVRKFTSPEYKWENISNKFREVIEKCLQ